MKAAVVTVGLLLALPAARVHAQERAAGTPAAPASRPAAPPASSNGLVIAPAKPVVAPGIAPRGDAGAIPTAARPANARTISVSAREAAEKTVAALVAAMKNLPKRPPAPPEPRPSRARRAGAAAQAQAFDVPQPIVYRVTWPAAPDEPGITRRVQLEWSGESAGAARLRWNTPTPE